jgi:methyltransferase
MTYEASVFVYALVFGLMLAETRVSVRTERALRARGAIEPPGDVYLGMLILYPLAFGLMGVEGISRAKAPAEVVAGSSQPAWWLAGILLMVASKALKYWAIASLGDRWTFRVLVLPGLPLVRRGPYRYVNHPNYIAVMGELIAMALMMSAWTTGPVMILAFGVVLLMRLKVETRALRDERPRR